MLKPQNMLAKMARKKLINYQLCAKYLKLIAKLNAKALSLLGRMKNLIN